MSLPTRREYLAAIYHRYRHSAKPEKSRMLKEFGRATGYQHKYAIRLLNRPLRRTPLPRRGRGCTYTNEDTYFLKKIWAILDYPCGTRLQPMVPEMITVLARCRELVVPPGVAGHLRQMSAPTIDRKLARCRHEAGRRLRGTTKPGSLLKKQIPIVLSRWDETRPGFCELDLVAHCGTFSAGDFVSTLNLTDLATGWSEEEAILGKAQKRVLAALRAIQGRLPFALRGLDPDNGSEFINWQLFTYCLQEKIDFTRGRPSHGNDNAHIEQKNWTHVRKVVGYARLETQAAADRLNALYREPLRAYLNCFQPVMKLIEKVRTGGHVKRRYDVPKTPYQRVLDSPQVPEEKKTTLRAWYATLNPAALKRDIERRLTQLRHLERIPKRTPATVTFQMTQRIPVRLHSQMI